MTCLGRGNYHHFISLLLGLGVMLSYGAYLSYRLLDQVIQETYTRASKGPVMRHWAHGLPLFRRIDYWTDAFVDDIRVGATGLLCLFTAPLAWGMLSYHVYLIWAGMTTNESFKWDDWKEDVSDGVVYKCEEPRGSKAAGPDGKAEPIIPWPVSSTQRLVSRGNEASLQAEQESRFTEPPWELVHSMKEVVNLYDLGFWSNLMDIFHR